MRNKPQPKQKYHEKLSTRGSERPVEGREKQHFRYIPKGAEGKMINFVGKQKPERKKRVLIVT
jgi:hypothetical protein